MSQSFDALDADYVLTLEEIANLTEEGSKPADTLMNVVALIATRFKTDVCSAYLLEPDRSNLVLAATLGLHPRCIGTLRLALNEGLAGLVAEQVRPVSVADVKNHPRFKFVKESGEEAYHSFLGVPLIDRGILQGVLVVQTKDSRVFQETEVRMLVEAANQVAPVVSEARTLDRFIAPAQERLWSLARNLWWSWDNDCISLFRDLNPTRWRELNQNPISLLSEIPLAEIERRATELMLHSRINYAYRRQQEYLQADRTWGAANAGCLRPRPVAYFSAEFGLHESLPYLLGRPWSSLRRPHQECVRSRHPARGRRIVLRTGILFATAGQGWLAARGVSPDRRKFVAHAAGNRHERRTRCPGDCHARQFHTRESLAH